MYKSFAYIALLVFSFYFCTTAECEESNDIQEIITQENKSSALSIATKDNSIDYEAFKSNFPDLKLENQHEIGNRLPYHPFIEDYFSAPFTQEDIDAGAKLEIYAIGKIIGYKGLDLYLLENIENRPDEDSYEHHIEDYRFLMIFKDGKPLMKENQSSQLRYTFNFNYHGEAGESKYECLFDKDTTIVVTEFNAESERATGYTTSIDSYKKYRYEITETGERKPIEITCIEFSSDFYMQSYIDKNKEYWIKDDSLRNFPTEESKLWMNASSYLFEEINMMEIPMNFNFYYKQIAGELRVIFESRTEDNTLIDQYILGASFQVKNEITDYSGHNKLLKCPIIIKTSDGNIEILPDGKFINTSNTE